MFIQTPNTARINLQNNNMTSIYNYSFAGLYNLRHLNLQGNRLFKIDEYAFHGLPYLKEIALSHCNLVTLKFDVVHLESILLFSINNCVITDFRLNISSFPNLKNLTLGNLKVSYMSVIQSDWSNLTVKGNNTFACCLFQSKWCSVPHNLTSLCMAHISPSYMIPMWVFGSLLLILSLLICILALFRSGGQLKLSGIAPFSKSVGHVCMGIYLILVGVKDHLFYKHLVSGILHSKHTLCVAAGLLQYYSIVVTYCMDTLHLYSLNLVTMDWSRDKSEVKTLIRRMCVGICFHVPVLFVLMNMIEYWVYGSYIDFGHGCSLILANELSINGKIFLAYIYIPYIITQILNYRLIRSFCKTLDASSAQAVLSEVWRESRAKSKRKIKLEYIVNGLAYLPLVVCIMCVLLSVNISTIVSLQLTYTLSVYVWTSIVRTLKTDVWTYIKESRSAN